jgi:putative Mn2+ efflux pump MntP
VAIIDSIKQNKTNKKKHKEKHQFNRTKAIKNTDKMEMLISLTLSTSICVQAEFTSHKVLTIPHRTGWGDM